MRPPIFVFAILVILPLLASCGSTGGGEPASNGNSGESDPGSAPALQGQLIRVEWINLNPRRNDPPIGLINRSSPELKLLWAKPERYGHIKPVDDAKMRDILKALRALDFYEHATEDLTLDSLRSGEAHGALTLVQGEKHYTLVFRPGMAGTGIPECYRDCKHTIIHVHRSTLWLAPTKDRPDPNRVFRVPSGRIRTR